MRPLIATIVGGRSRSEASGIPTKVGGLFTDFMKAVTLVADIPVSSSGVAGIYYIADSLSISRMQEE
jgi:hypothetical protein